METGRRDGPFQYWKCRCDCGAELEVRAYSLRSGNTKSCGCGRRDTLKKMLTIHGACESPEYNSWRAAKERCTNPNNIGFHNYGGRGITMCQKWLTSFDAFLKDMGRKPTARHTIERENNEIGYSPDNCVWALPVDQMENTRKTLWATHEGTRDTVKRWAIILGVPYTTVRWRSMNGKPLTHTPIVDHAGGVS